MTLDEWMVEHHDPKWKFKPYRVPAPDKPRAQRGRTFTEAAIDWQYRAWKDLRTILEPVSLDEFIARKRDPNWKPKKLSPRVAPKVLLTFDQRRKEEKWIADYVASFNKAAA